MTMTAAQQAQQNNRHTDGRYAEMPLADPGQLDLGCDHDEDPADFDWVRIESIIGTTMHLDPERTVSVPKMNPDDNIAQMTRKMMNYVAKTQSTDDLTDAEIAELVGLEASDEPMQVGLRRAFSIPDDGRVVTGLDERGRPVYISTGSDFKRTGRFRGGYSTANLSQRMVAHEFSTQFSAEHPEIPKAEIDTLFRRLEDKSVSGKRYAYLWDEDRLDTDVQLAILVAGGDLGRVDSMSPDEVRQLLSTLPTDTVTVFTQAGRTERPAYLVRTPWPTGGIRTAYLPMDRVDAELAGTTERARRAATNRAYRAFLEEQVNVEYDYQLQRGYVKRNDADHSATVFEQKKHVPQSHLDAAEQSPLHTSGDFGHIEVDERTDLDKLHQVENEWARLSRMLPKTGKTPNLRFRLTGRHKAEGVYHPHVDNIAVDPRHVRSFLHEYMHHVDHTAGGRNLSSGDDFRPLLRRVQGAMSAIKDPQISAKIDYYRTPTEVLSRTAEVYFHWKYPDTSLNGDAEHYATRPEYAAMAPMKDDIVAFWDAKLAELGVDLTR